MSNNINISIVVINYNGLMLTKRFIKSVNLQQGINADIIIIDNFSSEKIEKADFDKNKNIKLIKLDKNYGYSKGANEGVKYCKYSNILICNNDILFEENAISDMLIYFIKNENITVLQPKVILESNNSLLDSCGSFWTYTGFQYHYGNYKDKNLPIYNKSFPVYSIKGMCMLVNIKTIKKIGLFDEDFWCYFEETDFCHRVWISGGECWYTEKATIIHGLGTTSKSFPNSEIQFNSFKNRLKSYLKNLEIKTLIKILPVYTFFNLIWFFAFTAKLNFKQAIVPFRAFYWNIKNYKKIISDRNEIQNKIRTKDDMILSNLTVNPNISYYMYFFTSLGKYADKK